MVSEVGSELHGLEFSVKTASSLERKVQKKMQDNSWTEEEALDSMGDIVRYTQLCKHDQIAHTCSKTLDKLMEKGYTISKIENTWIDPNRAYKGINVNLTAPEGQKFELQFHSKESMDVKNQIHPLYEHQRTLPKESEEYQTLEKKMKEISLSLLPPGEIESVKNR